MLLVRKDDLQHLRKLAESAYPDEFCAILVGRRRGAERMVSRIVACSNEHPNRSRAYRIPAEALLRVQRDCRNEGLQILGFVHSHPDHPCKPSPSDLDQAFWPDCVYAILSVNQGECGDLGCYRLVLRADGASSFETEELVSSGPA